MMFGSIVTYSHVTKFLTSDNYVTSLHQLLLTLVSMEDQYLGSHHVPGSQTSGLILSLTVWSQSQPPAWIVLAASCSHSAHWVLAPLTEKGKITKSRPVSYQLLFCKWWSNAFSNESACIKGLKRSFTISQKKVAISLRFCSTAQMKSEAQGKRQRFSRYKQSPRSSLLAFWDGWKELVESWESRELPFSGLVNGYIFINLKNTLRVLLLDTICSKPKAL